MTKPSGALAPHHPPDFIGELWKKDHIAFMLTERPFSHVIDLLRRADLRPTRQRLALAKLLFENGDRHVSAEGLHEEALAANIDVSLATVYNTLHQFVAAGLLREIFVDASRSYFDTNTTEHHHLLFEPSGRVEDIPADKVVISDLPAPPQGMKVRRIDVIIRLSDENSN